MQNTWFAGDEVIEKAEECARLQVEETGETSTWVVCLRLSVFPPSFWRSGQEAALRDKLSRGHRPVLVGSVAGGKVRVAYTHAGVSPRGLSAVIEGALACAGNPA